MQKSISEKINEYSSELSESYPGFLSKYPIDQYIKEIQSYREYFSYGYVSPKLIKIFDDIVMEFSGCALVIYHKLALCTFILDTLDHLNSKDTPKRIINLYHDWFKRVLSDLSVQPDSYYHHIKDSFLKDLAICSRRAIPVGGAWLVEPQFLTNKYRNSAFCSVVKKKPKAEFDIKKLRIIVKRLLFRLDLLKVVRFLQVISRKYGLYYVIHTADRYLPGFTEHYMNQAYLNIVGLLKADRKVCGIYRKSWFLDPNLEKISPGLRFLWEVPVQNGAQLFCAGSSEKIISSALKKSPLRKRLYEEGKYIPMAYAYVWPRKELLQWAEGMILSKYTEGHK